MANEEIKEVAADLADVLTMLSNEFDDIARARHGEGAKKYGPTKFLTVDTLQEAMEEIVDLANYARYTYMQLRLVQLALLEKITETANPGEFIKTSEATKVRDR